MSLPLTVEPFWVPGPPRDMAVLEALQSWGKHVEWVEQDVVACAAGPAAGLPLLSVSTWELLRFLLTPLTTSPFCRI